MSFRSQKTNSIYYLEELVVSTKPEIADLDEPVRGHQERRRVYETQRVTETSTYTRIETKDRAFIRNGIS